MPAVATPAPPERFGPPPAAPPGRDLGRWVPFVAGLLVLVVVGGSLAWWRDDRSQVPDDVPVLVADGVRDDFTRAASPAPLGDARTGQRWDEVSGRWEVVEGEARIVEVNELGSRTVAVADLGSSDGAVAVRLPSVAEGAGVVFRYQDAFNYWLVTSAGAVGTWRLDRLEDGEVVSLGNLGLVGSVDGTTVEVRFEGRTITVFLDGEEHRQVVDGALETATGVGLVLATPAASEAAWDDLVAVPIDSGASASVAPS